MTLFKRTDYQGVILHSVINGVPQTGTYGGGFSQIEWGRNTPQSIRYGPGDSGTAMLLKRSTTTVSPGSGTSGNRSGQFVGTTSFAIGTGISVPSDSSIKAKGTTAIARTTPNSPAFSLPTAVGEVMKDGLPEIVGVHTWRDRTLRAKSASGEYLNYEFGWLPFIADLRRFAHSVRNSHKIISDFRKGSGKNIREGYDFPSSNFTAIEFRGSTPYFAGNSSAIISPSQSTYSVSSLNRAWFRGAFSYHIPVGNTQADRFSRYASYANKLLGVRLTPEVVWNLTPWSWALDWFGDAGDVIHNVSNLGQDGLTLRYGYVMNHTYTRSMWTSRALGSYTSTVSIDETKKRFAALPYFGFGAAGSLSATQSAILVALGINHLGK